MTQTVATPGSVPCIPHTFPQGLRRTRFFDGMFLTQADLEREQRYWMTKRRLTNRALGTGVVWGLRLEWDARSRCFRLGPGYALDCCGNDLVVECPQEIGERALLDRADSSVNALPAGAWKVGGRCPEPTEEDGPRKACLVLQYVEVPEEPKPVYRDACAREGDSCEFAAVRESTRLLLVPPPEPPPPSPLEAFCDGLDALRGAAGEEGSALAGLFGEASPEALGAVLTVHATGGRRGRPVTLFLSGHETVEEPLPGPADGVELRLEPAPGHVFLGGTVRRGGEETLVESFGATLEGDATEMAIERLQVAPLFGDGSWTETSFTVTLAAPDSNGNRPSVGMVVATPLDHRQHAGTTACPPPFAPPSGRLELGCDRGPCELRAAVLSVVWAWFQGWRRTGEVQGEKGQDGEEDPRYDGVDAVAWHATRAAWQLLFRVDASHAQRARLEALLHELFRAWCSGFVYPGPRCTDDHHGVYLGCVEISPRGRIVDFDPWAHRRHVVTGPLLAHWGGQLGLPPMDVVASRLASWICCVSSTGRGAEPLPEPEERLIPLGSGGAAMYYGSGEELTEVMEERGLTKVGDTRYVSHEELCRRIQWVLLRGGSRKVGWGMQQDRRVVYAVQGQPLHLVSADVMDVQPQPGSAERRVETLDASHDAPQAMVLPRTAAAYLEAAPPMARHAGRAFLVELAADTELGEMKVAEDHETWVEELESEAGVSTVAHLLTHSAEAWVRRIHPEVETMEAEEADAVYASANAVYAAAETLMSDVSERFANVAEESERPLVKRHLTESDVADKLRRAARTSYQSRKMTRRRMEEIGRRIHERGRSLGQ